VAQGRPRLPERTSRYNVGRVTGRYKTEDGKKNREFALRDQTAVRDGSGRELALVREPVMLNRRVVKWMDVNGDGQADVYVWGWAMDTDRGKLSGWISRSQVSDPPPLDPLADAPAVNPGPPRESAPLTVDCERANEALEDLRFKDRHGEIRCSGRSRGNSSERRTWAPSIPRTAIDGSPKVRHGVDHV
jgi:hypothetical protein